MSAPIFTREVETALSMLLINLIYDHKIPREIAITVRLYVEGLVNTHGTKKE